MTAPSPRAPRGVRTVRRWAAWTLAPLIAAALLTAVAPAAPAAADPDGSSATADDGDENPLLDDVLDSTGRRYLAAKAAVDKSAKAQLKLALEVKAAESTRDELLPEVGALAAQQYQTGGVTTASFLLSSADSDDFLKRSISLAEINTLNDHKLHDLNTAIDRVRAAKAQLDAEIRNQKTQLASMQKQKEAAEAALDLVGGKVVTGGLVTATSKVAAPAKRNADGGFSPEACSIDDPTTSGCVTARTLHMYQEVKKAGFNRFVGCHRNGGPFEHPKGRACDWSLQKSGFSPWHNKDTYEYGNNLMAFAVRNADRLGILYVIWNRMIWFPATGWKSYHGESNHTDHVHISML
jgi:peptidoglycan DL-endopeptidase CwlO